MFAFIKLLIFYIINFLLILFGENGGGGGGGQPGLLHWLSFLLMLVTLQGYSFQLILAQI